MSYTVKDGGARETYPSGMIREPISPGKPMFTLIPTFLLERLAMHLTKGMAKYSRDNWMLADSEAEWLRMRDSAFRHFVQWLDGDQDEDHAAAVCFNVFAAEHVKAKLDSKEGS
jgi:hypothetical protein